MIVLVTRRANAHRQIMACGIDAALLPETSAFFDIPANDDAPLAVTVASDDPRFHADPLLVQHPWIRSGLIVQIGRECGGTSGLLCALSPSASPFGDEYVAHASDLSALIGNLLASAVEGGDEVSFTGAAGPVLDFYAEAGAAAKLGFWKFDFDKSKVSLSPLTSHHFDLGLETTFMLGRALRLIHREDRGALQAAVMQALKDRLPFDIEVGFTDQDNTARRIRVIGSASFDQSDNQALTGVMLDSTADHLRATELRYAAERDSLTGLFNRAAFDRHLSQALKGAFCKPVIVALLDLDGFKEVNDVLGHVLGDRVLVAIADRLRRESQALAYVARWGGDEFALLFPPETHSDTALSFVTKLLGELNNLNVLSSDTLTLGASCGIVQVNRPMANDEVMRRADLALYDAKGSGRGKVSAWCLEMESALQARNTSMIQLQAALDQARTFPVYQPIVDLRSSVVVAVEALLRLNDPSGTVIAAEQLSPALLDRQLAHAVSRTMLADIVADGEQLLHLFGPDCEVAVNVSETDLRSAELGQKFFDALLRSPLNPRNFSIEVTESVLVRDYAGTAKAALKRLDSLGFSVSLDDFGTGICSLTQLRDFPISKVKIDRSLIARLHQDHQSRLMIKAIVQMSHSLKLKVVAEGVETEEQEHFLCSIGCDLAQGFRYGRPSTIADLPTMLADTRHVLRIERRARGRTRRAS